MEIIQAVVTLNLIQALWMLNQVRHEVLRCFSATTRCCSFLNGFFAHMERFSPRRRICALLADPHGQTGQVLRHVIDITSTFTATHFLPLSTAWPG